MKKYITEFIGTFFLMLTIIMSKNPIAIGSVLMIMVYAGGHISGAHYNPAVTLAVLIRKRIKINEAIPYWVSQVAGAVVSALLCYFIFGQKGSNDCNLYVLPFSETIKSLLAEILGTFALAYVVLNVATTKANAGNSFYGLAIGFTVLAMAFAFGNISGGAFNPAVAIGQAVAKNFCWEHIWIYLVGCFGGAVLAAWIFNMNNPDDK